MKGFGFPKIIVMYIPKILYRNINHLTEIFTFFAD